MTIAVVDLSNAVRGSSVSSRPLPRYMSLSDWWAFYCPSMLTELEPMGVHPEAAYDLEKRWLLETSLMLGEDVRFRDATSDEADAGVEGPVPMFRRSLFLALPDGISTDIAPVDWAAVRGSMDGSLAGRCRVS